MAISCPLRLPTTILAATVAGPPAAIILAVSRRWRALAAASGLHPRPSGAAAVRQRPTTFAVATITGPRGTAAATAAASGGA